MSFMELCHRIQEKRSGTFVPIPGHTCAILPPVPDQPTWIHRLPEILAWLESSEAPPFLHRGLIESQFGLRRRQALRLMEKAGGYQVGRTYLIDRLELARYLGNRDASATAKATRRKMRLEETIAESRRQMEAKRLRVPVDSAFANPTAASPTLPPGIEPVSRDRLEIRYLGAEDLLSKVAALAAFAVKEPAIFRATFEEGEKP